MQLMNESSNVLRQIENLDLRFSGENMNCFRQMRVLGQTFPNSPIDLHHIHKLFSPLFLTGSISIYVQCQWAPVKPSTETDLFLPKKRLFLHV